MQEGTTTGLNMCSVHLMSLHPSVVTHVLPTTLEITVSCIDAYPRIHVDLTITVVTCSTHQELFEQELASWSVTSEVSTTDPSFRVEFPGPKQHNYQKEDATSACSAKKEVQNLVMLSLVLSTVFIPDTGYGGELFKMLRSTRTQLSSSRQTSLWMDVARKSVCRTVLLQRVGHRGGGARNRQNKRATRSLVCALRFALCGIKKKEHRAPRFTAKCFCFSWRPPRLQETRICDESDTLRCCSEHKNGTGGRDGWVDRLLCTVTVECGGVWDGRSMSAAWCGEGLCSVVHET